MNKDEEINKLNQPFLSEVDDPESVLKFDFIYERIERWRRLYYSLTNGSTSGSVFCLLCITFSSGILALPYSFKHSGIILGTILFLIATACIYWTIRLLTKVAFRTNTINYSLLIFQYFDKIKL
jgi:Kef-type K+ transport system membrane component KefB